MKEIKKILYAVAKNGTKGTSDNINKRVMIQAEDDIEKVMLDVINKEFGKIPPNKVIKDKALKKFAQHYYQGKFDVLMNLMIKIRKPKR